jgi:hypothetical protein
MSVLNFPGLIGLPGAFICLYVVRLGRKKTICISYIVAGTACLLLVAVPSGQYRSPTYCMPIINPRQYKLSS